MSLTSDAGGGGWERDNCVSAERGRRKESAINSVKKRTMQGGTERGIPPVSGLWKGTQGKELG